MSNSRSLRSMGFPTVSFAAALLYTALVCTALFVAAPAWSQEPAAETTEPAGSEEEVAVPEEPGQVADPGLDVAAIIAKHLEARLPEQAVRSVVAEGKLVFMGLQLPLDLTILRPRSARLEADMAGSPMILAFNGESGWTVSPLQGIPEPEALEEDAEEAVALFSDFLWGLLDGAQKAGTEVTLRGIEVVGGHETYVLELGGEYPRTLYLGGADFLEHRLELSAVFMGTQQDLEAGLGDYRNVDGLMVPHDIQLLSAGTPLAQVVLTSVATNETVDPSIFDLPPPPPPAPAAAAAEGEDEDSPPFR